MVKFFWSHGHQIRQCPVCSGSLCLHSLGRAFEAVFRNCKVLNKLGDTYHVTGPNLVPSEMVQRHDISWIKAYAIAIASLLSGAAVVHNIFKPDLVFSGLSQHIP